MGTITTSDGTQLFHKDWDTGQPVLFSHGWPLNADAWDDQLLVVADNGYRAIAHDRRAHGRSSQPWTGHDLDTYAGEVTRYVGRHGTDRVAKLLLLGAITPLMLKTDANPKGRRSRPSTPSAPAWRATAASSTRT